MSINSPYSSLPSVNFWRTGVTESSPFDLNGIYVKKWNIKASDKIATAGSCFAQHIARYMRKNKYNVMDVEPAPEGLPPEKHNSFGYSMYSARYGNVYTVRQLLQLLKEINGELVLKPEDYIWEKNGRFYDAFRPNVEPHGFSTQEELIVHRKFHLKKVSKLFKMMDVFIFTLGLTETWECEDTGLVYPTAPGTIAGSFEDDKYSFKNFTYNEVYKDFRQVQKILNELRVGRKKLRYLLTVSPVPLTATCSDRHILQASTYSKSVLRAVAGDLSKVKNIDYFPSYEIITNVASHGVFYENNLRTVRAGGVDCVMKVFFSQHRLEYSNATAPELNQSSADEVDESEDVQCEEALLEAFGKK